MNADRHTPATDAGQTRSTLVGVRLAAAILALAAGAAALILAILLVKSALT